MYQLVSLEGHFCNQRFGSRSCFSGQALMGYDLVPEDQHTVEKNSHRQERIGDLVGLAYTGEKQEGKMELESRAV